MTTSRDLLGRLHRGPMFKQWHWLSWNFQPGLETPFATSALDALVRCDEVMPGYADAMLTRLESIGGRDRNLDDYEAIRQWLGELLVVNHFVEWIWPESVTFEHEPTAPGSATNPEITVSAATWRLGIEVKTPDLRTISSERGAHDWQMLARTTGGPGSIPGTVTLPRDNPVKDFLISADKKFAGFRAADTGFRGVLVIVWDDYVQEPLSALASPSSGLLTQQSFFRDAAGKPTEFPNVDAVILLRHQHQFVEGMANRPAVDDRYNFLDYGDTERFPFHVIVPNPNGMELEPVMVDALQAHFPDPRLGAEYWPAELVMWV